MNGASAPRSVVVAAVCGSVRRHEMLDDAEALRFVERCLKRMARAVDSAGGRVVGSVGVELVAVFEGPDQACRAVHEMLQGVADLPPLAAQRPAIRVGFAHGSFDEDQEGRCGGDAVSLAAQLAGLAQPGQGLTCAETHARLSAAAQQSLSEVGALAAKGGLVGARLFGLGAAPMEPRSLPFTLRYGDQLLSLDETRPSISIGRDAPCDVMIHDRRASRRHARIEKRGEQVFLVDHSSNGSYLTLAGQTEIFVRGEECLLHGRGVICFAASAASAGADCAQFEG